MNVFKHSGDFGDIIAALPIMRHLGGGKLILGAAYGVNGARESFRAERFNTIAPLLRQQPYLSSVEYDNKPKGVTYDFDYFRVMPIRDKGHNLINWQSDYFGIDEVDMSPWLHVKPSKQSNGKVIFARTQRYHNPRFNWEKVVKSNPDGIFIGLHDEYWAFRAAARMAEVTWIETKDLLEVAQLIAGSDKIICNQSCPFWIAIGLGHTVVQETDVQILNSIVSERKNSTYCMGYYP